MNNHINDGIQYQQRNNNINNQNIYSHQYPNPIIISDLTQHQKININGEILEIEPLGSGCEVGRSCVILIFQNKKIMLDCGLHPAYNGTSSLPFFDEIDPSDIDLLLITHFHLDHCGALPYFLEKTNFHGECYMTHPTRAIYKLILADYVKVSYSKAEESLFKEQDLKNSLEKIKSVDYHQEIEYKGIKFSAYNAGHVLGAAMFLVEISGVNILYTGDYSREYDRHLQPAEVPNKEINVLIIESTYGINQHEDRDVREKNFTKYVDEVVSRGGKCLLPVFALGRAQELLLILDEFWESNLDKFGDIPIYYASSLAKNSIEIFRSYINMAGDYVKKKNFEGRKNPFEFKHIKPVKVETEINEVDGNKPCVVFASPGMLQNGLSKNLFEKWCSDEKNGIVITGYCVERTLAKTVLGEPARIKISPDKPEQDLKMSVKYVTFSAHSDFKHNSEFIQKLEPKNIILVHGEGKEMERLRNAYERLKVENENFKKFLPKVFNPQNCQKIVIPFVIPKKGFIIGKLCTDLFDAITKNKQKGCELLNDNHFIKNNHNQLSDKMDIEDSFNEEKTEISKGEELEENFFEVAGILIDEENILLNSDEIEEFSSNNMKSVQLKQILKVKYTLCDGILFTILKDYFNTFNQITDNKYKICSEVDLILNKGEYIVLEWYSNGYSDFLANSIAMIITQLETCPNNNVFYHYSNNDTLCSFKKQKLIDYLNSKYIDVEAQADNIKLIDYSQKTAEINTKNLQVSCNDNELKQKLILDLEQFKEL